MATKPIVDGKRIAATAEFIRAELRSVLDHHNIDAPLNGALRERCPTYRHDLTNAEKHLAIIRALALVQLDVGEGFARLEYEDGDFDLDDDASTAGEAAAEIASKLEHQTPADLGFGEMTPEELITSERQAWRDEERRIAGLDG